MFVWKGNISSEVSESFLPLLKTSCTHKQLPRFFLCILSSLTCLGKTCFQQAGSSTVEGTSHAALGSSDQRKVPASLSLFLKLGKIPALFYVGKGHEYRPFRDLRFVLEAGTQALLLCKTNSKVNHELATTRE
jgi:hypothetical protein